jgi:hypothetical protein
VKSYRPSNGCEGLDFMAEFCDRCKRDAEYRRTRDGEKGCPIAAAALAFVVDDPRYPKEWITDAAGPRCTAFEPEAGP